mgnify:CR=1 FL=1
MTQQDLDFNSIKVRLNHKFVLTIEVNATKFQFHKGTIKPQGKRPHDASSVVISIP